MPAATAAFHSGRVAPYRCDVDGRGFCWTPTDDPGCIRPLYEKSEGDDEAESDEIEMPLKDWHTPDDAPDQKRASAGPSAQTRSFRSWRKSRQI